MMTCSIARGVELVVTGSQTVWSVTNVTAAST